MEELEPRPVILVVDDNRLDRELLRDAVAPLGEVRGCVSGEAALATLADEGADLVISDLTMPGMSGLALQQALARRHPSVDFILITATGSLETALEAMRGGAVDYLLKPVSVEKLRAVASRALEARRLRAENDHLRSLLATMDDCRSLAAAVEPAEIHGIALDVLMRRLGRARGVAIYRGPSLGTDEVLTRGFDDTTTERLRGLIGGEKRSEVSATLEAEVVEGGALVELLREAGIEAPRWLVVPMDASNQDEVGFLLLPEERAPFGDDDLEIARMVAAYGQVGVYNAERYLRAKERAFIDDVTGAYNARYLFAALEHELRRADRYGSELSLIFLDVDRFKLVNDSHGHLVGSRTLRALSQVLLGCIRQVDTLARYGGDEFTILLADTSHETAQTVAERIRAAVATAEFEGQGSSLHITVSIGVASFPEHAQSGEALLDLADKAMYRAKSLGRDRVCSAAELE